MSSSSAPRRGNGILGSVGLALAAVLIHGYHLGTDDAAIWVPAIKKAADPSLYPFGSEFFLTHAHMSLFPYLVGWFARLSHLPADLVIFLCHLAGVFLLLLASWRFLANCFENDRARWAGVALLAALFSVPVTGTALPIMDPYVTSRSLSTPFALFAVAAYLAERKRAALAWLTACTLIHPQMMLFVVILLSAMEVSRRRAAASIPAPVFGLFLFAGFPLIWDLSPATGPARDALLSRDYFFVTNWTWYEWLGVAAPLALLWWLGRTRLRGALPPLAGLLANLVKYGLLATAAGLVLSSSPLLENYARLQPMRAFHLLYIVMFLVTGALAGEYLLKRRLWRWFALFTPLAAGMWLVGREAYANSPHIEWPGAAPHGEWASAFRWVRDHTPKDAVFAMDPDYLFLPGEDHHGFRAVAERSALADRLKDSGAVSLFPQLANDWQKEVQAQTGLAHFSTADFENLTRSYPVTWVITQRSTSADLDCPYRGSTLAICRVGAPATALLRFR